MLTIETDGYTRPCCLETTEESRITHISDGILNAFNHETLLQLRKDLLNGYSDKTRDFCRRCEDLEIRGQPSLRNKTPFKDRSRKLKFIQFKLSNKCQLACFHCGPKHSSAWAKLSNEPPFVRSGFDITDSFLQELKELLPDLEMIKFTGGEPFIDPNHWRILEAIQDSDRSNCELFYITNGVTPFKPVFWKGWKKITCSVSVDGHEESYEWFRRGSSWNTLVANVDKLSNECNIEINYSITPYTIQDYHKSKNYWKFSHLPTPIIDPKHCSLIEFPFEVVKRIDDYKTIPYIELAKGKSLQHYVDWAKKWDAAWHTEGKAEELYWWCK